MSRQWMYSDRRGLDFINGMHSFLRVANDNKPSSGYILCPCRVCKNKRDYSNTDRIHFHLIPSGFMPGSNCWTKHGEKGVMMEENEEEEDNDTYPTFTADGDTPMGKTKLKKSPMMMSPMMILAGPFLMHG